MIRNFVPYSYLASPGDLESGMTLDPWTLKYTGSSGKLETLFLLEYYLGALQHGRIAVVFGALMISVFGFLDLLVVNENLGAILLIRYGFILPLLLSFFLFSFSDIFQRHIQSMITAMVSATGLALSLIVVLAPVDVSHMHFAGNMLVIIFAYGFLRLRFIWANIAALTIVTSYFAIDIFVGQTPLDEQLMRVFYSISTSVLGMFVAYSSEYYSRRNYFLRHRLNDRTSELENTRKDLEQRVEETTREALAAVRAKSNFLANMSHEIRTPMNGVLGMLELLKDAQLNSSQTEQIETAYQSAEGLLEIINDVLDVSKIEAGKMALHKEAVSPGILIEDICTLLAPQIVGKQLQLVHEIAPEAYDFYSLDGTRLRQIILNLLGNALKFTDRGSIRINCKLQNNELFIEVCDTGIGILPEHQEHLFDAFSQADNSAARAFGGTGLGLSITKHLTELMQGTIKVESQLSMGSVFKLSIPTTKTVPTKSHSRNAAPLSRAKKVFFLVESKYQSKAIRYMLERLQCDISSLEEAEVAITDLGLIDCGDIPVICVGDQSEVEFRSHNKGCDAVSYFQFPITISVLASAIESKQESNTATEVELPAEFSDNKVLLVEDNEVNQKVASAMLSRLGVKAQVVSGGQQALECIEMAQYDLILMDCQMPGMDGFETTQAIRLYETENNRKNTAIVALTANAMAGDRERCLESGMDDYLAKPINLSGLTQIFQRWM